MWSRRIFLSISPIIVLVFWLVILKQWTLGFSAFTTYSYVLKNAGPLPRSMPTFNLINRFGKQIQSDHFKEKYVLLTFVYLRCPTVCPIVLGKYMNIYRTLKQEIPNKLLLATISIDKKHDTPAISNSSWNAFGQPQGWFVGSLASELTEPARAKLSRLGVWAYQQPDGFFNHSSYIFLINSDAQVIHIYQPEQSSDEIIHSLRDVIT